MHLVESPLGEPAVVLDLPDGEVDASVLGGVGESIVDDLLDHVDDVADALAGLGVDVGLVDSELGGILEVLLDVPLGELEGLDAFLRFLDFFDFISNSVLMPIVAFFTCVFVGYVIKPTAIAEEVEISGTFKRKAIFNVIIKYFAPICIVLILLSSVLDAFGIFKI